MRVLLSAFACSPLWGSEPGVGWRWVIELSRKHHVTVLTHSYFHEHIRDSIINDHIDFVYYKLPGIKIHPHKLLNSRVYYSFWQVGAWLRARRLVMDNKFDVVHHLTWATFRFPSLMGFLGLPFVYGPLGGGERSPFRLREKMPRVEFLFELIRDLFLILSYLNPFVWLSLRQATLILACTQESKRFMSTFGVRNIIVRQNIGCNELNYQVSKANHDSNGSLLLLYVGRLVGLKGVHFAIRALAKARLEGVDVVLHVVGNGPMLSHLQELALQFFVQNYVFFHGELPHHEVVNLYKNMDLFVFPSLHDSGGTVVLESLAAGVPVLCLDLGGPKYFVDDSCGRIVSTINKSVDDIVTSMANEIVMLAGNSKTLADLRIGACEKATLLSWGNQVNKVYFDIERLICDSTFSDSNT